MPWRCPLRADGVSADIARADHSAFTFDGKLDEIIRDWADRAAGVADLGVDANPVGAVGGERRDRKSVCRIDSLAHAGRMDDVRGDDLSSIISFGR